MKILFVTNWYPHEKNPVFGIFIREHAKALQKSGIDVRVLQIYNQYARNIYQVRSRKSTWNGIKTYQVFIRSYFSDILQYIWPLLKYETSRAIESEFDNYTPDIVHGHVIFSAGFLAQYLAKRYRVPYLITEHWSKISAFLENPFFKSKAGKVYSGAARVLPVSDWLKYELTRRLELPARLKVIPNVVDPTIFNYNDHLRRKRKNNGLRLLAVQNFHHKAKRPDLLLDALIQLSPVRQQKMHLVFVGSGIDPQEQNDYKKRFGKHAGISFKSSMSREQLSVEMGKADFLLHPSDIETFGLVVAEALSVGLPSIVSSRGALPELIEEDTGITVASNSTKAWAEVLNRAYKYKERNKFDRAQIAAKNMNRYHPDTVASMITDCYKMA